MRIGDPRHGTSAGYQKHRRDGEEACDPCRIAKSARSADERHRDTEEVALTGGSWQPRDGIMRWVADGAA